MKKLAIIVISLVFCLPFLLKAQGDAGYKPFCFGLKAVPSISFMKSEVKDIKNGNPSLNFGYGLIAEFNFAANYALLTGIEINDNSGNIDYGSNSNIFYNIGGDTSRPFYLDSRKYSIKYLNIPVLLKLKTNEIGFLKYYGQFGVDLGFRLKARATDKDTSGLQNNDVIIDEDISLMRLGLNVGLGAEYNLAGNTSIVFGLNYNNGFTNFIKSKSEYLYVDSGQLVNAPLSGLKAFNNYVTLTVGILF